MVRADLRAALLVLDMRNNYPVISVPSRKNFKQPKKDFPPLFFRG